MRAARAGPAVRSLEETERAEPRNAADRGVAFLKTLRDLRAAGSVARGTDVGADGVIAGRIDSRAPRAAAGAVDDRAREFWIGTAGPVASARAAVRSLQEAGRAEAGHARHTNLAHGLALRDVGGARVVARRAEGRAASIERSQGSAAAASASAGSPSAAATRAREPNRPSHRPSHAVHTARSHAHPLARPRSPRCLEAVARHRVTCPGHPENDQTSRFSMRRARARVLRYRTACPILPP
jgi:hypothetical protein